MWGFVSVMLALLFMFLPATTDTPRPIPVDQPVSYHCSPMPGVQKEDAIQISVTRDGSIYFRHDRIMFQDLPAEIAKGLQDGAEKRVYLNADARARYADVAAVLDQIRMSGIENVSFLTQKPYR